MEWTRLLRDLDTSQERLRAVTRDMFPQLAGPPVMVFQDVDDPPVAAGFGEVMCSSYKAFGAAGLITNGLIGRHDGNFHQTT